MDRHPFRTITQKCTRCRATGRVAKESRGLEEEAVEPTAVESSAGTEFGQEPDPFREVRPESPLGRRSAGVLCHPTSLPGPYAVGDLGPGARRFVDFLAEAGQRIWQVLPLGPPGFGMTPYQTLSAFAGSPSLISPDLLFEDGLLDRETLEAARIGPSERETALWRAFERFREGAGDHADFAAFCDRESSWLDDFVLFAVAKGFRGGKPWLQWDRPLGMREPWAVERLRQDRAEQIAYQTFLQWQFRRQWDALRRHARARGVALVGDAPIFVSLDSADVWSNPDIFLLDEERRPRSVAGVPPDYFSKDGQLWGNPLYDWDALRGRGFDWWVARLRTIFALCDAVRLDHFIGFYRAWAVPSGSKTARRGKWLLVPGEEMFARARAELGTLPVIAEDLGFLIDEVRELRDRLEFPGMKVLQFAFSGGNDNEHLPFRAPANSVVYTGTHDNDTTLGWWKRKPRRRGEAAGIAHEREHFQRYVGRPVRARDVHWEMIRLAHASAANTVIVPMQDLLGLGSRARMNTPGRRSGNWSWRFDAADLTPELAARVRSLTETFGRF
ncbi:MAG: 4-alpha-glucanotransferase [Candidatus Eisenbacteria bacterium]|nr:4-alpha-glucanotransferase [Candidatus Eisenbacteria bacterium]